MILLVSVKCEMYMVKGPCIALINHCMGNFTFRSSQSLICLDMCPISDMIQNSSQKLVNLYKGYWIKLQYFFDYKTDFFFLPKQSQNLDGSTSLGLFRKGKTCITAKFQRIYLVICSNSRQGETPIL